MYLIITIICLTPPLSLKLVLPWGIRQLSTTYNSPGNKR